MDVAAALPDELYERSWGDWPQDGSKSAGSYQRLHCRKASARQPRFFKIARRF